MGAFSRPALRNIQGRANAALQNEMLTRERVDVLEAEMKVVRHVLAAGFWGRLRWLIQGK